jgi:hypothetical protein
MTVFDFLAVIQARLTAMTGYVNHKLMMRELSDARPTLFLLTSIFETHAAVDGFLRA